MNNSDEGAFPPPVDSYLALRFPALPTDRPYVFLNMVASADGKAVAGTDEAPLSSAIDKLTLQALRAHADGILNGASTARATGVTPLIRDARLQREQLRLGHKGPPVQVVLSTSGAISPDARFLRRQDFKVVLAVSESAPAERIAALRTTSATLELLPDGPAGLTELMRRLRRSHGIGHLLVEGGPTLNSALFHAGLIDEFFLTVGPHIVGGRNTLTPVEGDPFVSGALPQLTLVSAIPNAQTSEIYLHWAVERGVSGA